MTITANYYTQYSLLIAIKVMMGQKRVDCDDGATMLEVTRQF